MYMYCFQLLHLGGCAVGTTLLLILLLLLFPQCGQKSCCGYTAYRVNIWGLLDPVGNRAINHLLTDQQASNIINHLRKHHGIEREDIRYSDLPQGEPPFPGTLTFLQTYLDYGEGWLLQQLRSFSLWAPVNSEETFRAENNYGLVPRPPAASRIRHL